MSSTIDYRLHEDGLFESVDLNPDGWEDSAHKLITRDSLTFQRLFKIGEAIYSSDTPMDQGACQGIPDLITPNDGLVYFIQVISGRAYTSIKSIVKTIDPGDILIVDQSKIAEIIFHKARIDFLCFLNNYKASLVQRDKLPKFIEAGTLKNRIASMHMGSILGSFMNDGKTPLRPGWQHHAVMNYCIEDFREPVNELNWMNDLRSEVLEFIESNLHDPYLTGSSIVKKFRISKSYLYKIFPSAGGIQRYIRDRRLDVAFFQIRRNPGINVCHLAKTLGFSSGKQFLKHFHSRFDMNPDMVACWQRHLPEVS